MLGLARSRAARETAVPALSILTLALAIALSVGQWGEREDLIAGALRLDELTLILTILFCVAGIATVLLSWRHVAPREAAHGEYHALLLTSIAGMIVLVAAQNLVSVFLGLELLSIPLYVLCATEMRRASSLESGLKYLVIGSVGSATLLYGLAFLYGATGSTDFSGIAEALGGVERGRHRPAAADRHRADDRRPGLQGLRGAVSPVDARRLRGRADADHRVHGRRHEGRGVRRHAAPVRRRADRRRRSTGRRRSRCSRRSRSSSATSARWARPR